jgi:hypothetical protein
LIATPLHQSLTWCTRRMDRLGKGSETPGLAKTEEGEASNWRDSVRLRENAEDEERRRPRGGLDYDARQKHELPHISGTDAMRYSPAPLKAKSARMIPPAAATPKVTCRANTIPGFRALRSCSKTRRARCTLSAENLDAPRTSGGGISDTGRRRPWAETGEKNDRHMASSYLLLI